MFQILRKLEMNIIILSRFFSPSAGGSELLFCEIAELLAQNGQKVWVITNKLEDLESPTHENINTIGYIYSLMQYSINEKA